MSNEIRHRIYELTIDEWIERFPAELDTDSIALWIIVFTGEDGFGLSGDALNNYVRRTILSFLAKGAKPVAWHGVGWRGWRVVDYGEKPEDIAEAIIKEWQERIANADYWPAVFVSFALPHIYDPPPSTVP